MRRVGIIRDQAEHDRKCWACRWTYADVTSGVFSRQASQWRYETAVEAIESTAGREFTRPDLWRAVGGGPSLYNAFGFAIHDMRMHGLLTCVQRTGRKCFRWRLTGWGDDGQQA